MAFHFIVTCVSQKKVKKFHSILDPEIRPGSLEEVFSQWQDTLKQSNIKQKTPLQLYNGGLWGSLLDSWGIINGRVQDAHLWIMSAGHGLIRAEDKIVPYDVTFQDSRGDVPSIFSKIDYVPMPSARKKIRQGWWKQLIEAKSDSPNSLEALIRRLDENDYAVIILGKDYLDAVYSDLRKALNETCCRDHIAVVSNNVNDPVAKKLGANWLYADSRFVKLPKSNSTFVNAKVGHQLLYHMFEEMGGLSWWSLKNFNNYLKELSAKLPEPIRHSRTPSSDEEVKDFIEKALQKEDVPFTRLHRAYRDSGRACEYARFRGLYATVKEEAEKSVPQMRPTLPVKYKKRSARVEFFLPDWDDRVDPLFDFEKDEPTPGRDPYEHDAYHYELYGHLNCDGILVSKSVLEANKKKLEKVRQIGIHKYLRLPRKVPILGDCGAFNYITAEKPPYETEEILEYYDGLGFDYGVSVDHIIVPGILKRERLLQQNGTEWHEISEQDFERLVASKHDVKILKTRAKGTSSRPFANQISIVKEIYIDEAERSRRYNLTCSNAKDFIDLHRKKGGRFTPIGAVQGWSPESYAEAVQEYQEMGYDYIALGGLVRSTTQVILEILEAVSKVKKKRTKMHLFGVARLEALEDFMRYGISSVDSAGMLRQAWLSSSNNYYSPDRNHYTAIRVPPADKGAKAKTVLKSGNISQEELLSREKVVLSMLRKYGSGNAGLDHVLDAVMTYHRTMLGDVRLANNYLRTLSEKPWEKCHCKLCEDVGIDMVIFRRNNRNRRRGFHNTWLFFNIFKQLTGNRSRR